MSRAVQEWRLAITAWFVVWLSVQFTIIGLAPGWGIVLPHSHITSGPMTEADWAEHAREHQLGFASHYAYESGRGAPAPAVGAHVIASLPDADGISSFLPAFTAVLAAHEIKMPACHLPEARVLREQFAVRDWYETPPKPPPNLHREI